MEPDTKGWSILGMPAWPPVFDGQQIASWGAMGSSVGAVEICLGSSPSLIYFLLYYHNTIMMIS